MRTPMALPTLFTIAKTQKRPKYPSIDEWIKMWSIHTMDSAIHTILSHKNNEPMPSAATCSNMHATSNYHTKCG